MATGQDHYTEAELALTRASQASDVDDQTFCLLAAIANAILAAANANNLYS